MMKYSFYVTQNGIIYSLDMLRLRVEIMEPKLNDLFHIFVANETHKNSKVVNNNELLRYRHFISCTYKNNKSIKLGFYMNGVAYENRHLGFIEFNPNSFAEIDEFWEDFTLLKSFFPYIDILRFDIAIDIPIARNEIVMLKDNRTYGAIKKSPLDFTENLGSRNTVGRVKLYNKTIESKLDSTLTRLEITGDLNNVNIPRVFDLRQVPASDKDLVKTILKNDYFTLAISDLSFYKRVKVLTHIEDSEIHFSEKCINEVIDYAKQLTL